MRYKKVKILLKKIFLEHYRHRINRKDLSAYKSLSDELYKEHGVFAVIELNRLITRHYIKKRAVALLNFSDDYQDYFFPKIDIYHAIPLVKISKVINADISGDLYEHRVELGDEQLVTNEHANLLPWAWSQHRLTKCLQVIGNDRKNRWEYDDNHQIVYIYPFDVEIVEGGNHSITTGMLKNEGSIPLKSYYYDMAFLYKKLSYDGKYWHYNDATYHLKLKADYGVEFLGIIYELSRHIYTAKLEPKQILNYSEWNYKSNILTLLKSYFPKQYKQWVTTDNKYKNVLQEIYKLAGEQSLEVKICSSCKCDEETLKHYGQGNISLLQISNEYICTDCLERKWSKKN